MGAGTYRPDRSIPGGIASIVPSLRYQRGPFEVNALGVYSDAPAGRWNFQGGTEAFARTPAFGFLLLEASGKAEWTSHYRVHGTTAFSGGLRAYLTTGSRARAWVGRTVGRATALGTRRPLRRTEVGGSAALAAVHLAFTLANTTVDRSYMLSPVDPREPMADTMASYPEPSAQHQVDRLALTDAVLSGRWRLHSFDFDASLGRRFSRSTPETLIWGLSASRDLAPTLALVAAAGRAGSDPVTSVPGARYFAVGLRLKVGAPVPLSLPAGDHVPTRPHPSGSDRRSQPGARSWSRRPTPRRSSSRETSPTGSRSRCGAGARTRGARCFRCRPACTGSRSASMAASGAPRPAPVRSRASSADRSPRSSSN